MPYEKDFCQSCNRLRVSSLGNLHLCLFGENGIPLRDLLSDDNQNEALKARIQSGLQFKRETHFYIWATVASPRIYPLLAVNEFLIFQEKICPN